MVSRGRTVFCGFGVNFLVIFLEDFYFFLVWLIFGLGDLVLF